MSNNLDWHKFYFKLWSGDESVKLMTLEQVGAYWQLLVHQMNEGSLPDNHGSLARILGVDTGEFLSRVWDPTAGVRVSSKFVPLQGRPGRLHNEHMTRVMESDFQKRDNYARAGQASREARAREQAQRSSSLTPDPDAAPTEVSGEEYAAAVKEFPKRKEWREGLDEGERLMRDTITTRDQYTRFLAAVRNYRRACSKPGHDKRYTMTFGSFMQKWTEHVPDDALRAAPPAAAGPAPDPHAAEAARRRAQAQIEGWPWEGLGPGRAEQLWPEERRRAYESGLPVQPVAVGE